MSLKEEHSDLVLVFWAKLDDSRKYFHFVHVACMVFQKNFHYIQRGAAGFAGGFRGKEAFEQCCKRRHDADRERAMDTALQDEGDEARGNTAPS